MSHSILIVEDDLTFSTMLKTWLGKKGFSVDTASSNARARKQLDAQSYDLILSDLRLPDQDGIFLLSWMKEQGYDIPLIIMTGYADIQSAVQAIKHGASDYISKPVQPDELLKKIDEALQGKALPTAPQAGTGKTPSAPKASGRKIVPHSTTVLPSNFLEGESEAARQLYNYVGLVAPTPMSVLINGASGTGKEYVAHRIHQLSKRADKPFIAIDCGSIPKELAASEFFGHVKGSFTGALNDKTGAFVEANGGTLFLDEIGNLSYEVQIQLLRALQERRIRPVGSSKEIEVDVRLISATNENLQQAIEKGNFREDLYHRINEFTLRMPALKERQEDILLFANFFLDQANRELDRRLTGFDAAASQALQTYSWPGNLRQLKNIVKRATLLAQSNFITLAELGYELQEPVRSAGTQTFSLHDEAAEKKRILEALKQTGNNKSKAAVLLGIDRKTLYNKLKLYDIQ
ncbi:MAG: sigma-54-dependent Fis family transcriptional regulator [Bacteroides sp.]|jgi:two-component system response regulator|uniref:Two-component system, NtrC family, response regulator HydG n=1 Tax=Phocaeicola sartorii TaxID=671267 RepID=R9HZ03_9BACT|nr:sigma-54 dependent transcriptional regulator [Phocaeicola sartorii]MBO5506202.1 sigma-54-dependent Fis family transcriptional regulator [Bacteroides sp.]EOS09222.1 two-component system, NtrC family, response regulator HydG [Phocaeicola sartorii]MCR1846963.1 sigma-54 dependent transcriptional regulator [Phocaeicola sartorii]NBH65897.1 sigma-54-dependent Fis family transcriptional regulator [Phocaeicola sartorii]NUL01097.1 sigma-54-dependent Fis family transcriptional regulator [Phocaeicola s